MQKLSRCPPFAPRPTYTRLRGGSCGNLPAAYWQASNTGAAQANEFLRFSPRPRQRPQIDAGSPSSSHVPIRDGRRPGNAKPMIAVMATSVGLRGRPERGRGCARHTLELVRESRFTFTRVDRETRDVRSGRGATWKRAKDPCAFRRVPAGYALVASAGFRWIVRGGRRSFRRDPYPGLAIRSESGDALVLSAVTISACRPPVGVPEGCEPVRPDLILALAISYTIPGCAGDWFGG